MSKEDAINPDGAAHIFNRLKSLNIILKSGWGNEKWVINEVRWPNDFGYNRKTGWGRQRNMY